MIGMAIFAIGFLAVSSMQITAIQGNGSAREGTEAATLAAEQAERLMALPYANIVNGGPVIQGAYRLRWNVAIDNPVDRYKNHHHQCRMAGSRRQEFLRQLHQG